MSQTRRAFLTGSAGLTALGVAGCSRQADRGGRSAPEATEDVSDTSAGGAASGHGPSVGRQPAIDGAASPLGRIEAAGPPRVRGQAQGAALREQIQASVAAFMTQTRSLREGSEAATRWEAALDATIKGMARYPEALEELDGMQVESGVDARAHRAFALATEFLPALDQAVARDHIVRWWQSDVVAVPNLTGRVTRIAFCLRGEAPVCVVDHLDASRVPLGLTVGRPGTLGAFGVGPAGVACAAQPLFDCTPVTGGGSLAGAFRSALAAPDHHAATRSLTQGKLAASASLFIADPTKALSVESRPRGVRVLGAFANSAVAAHTNHAVEPLEDKDPRMVASLERLRALRAVVPAGTDPTLDEFISAMIKGPAAGALDPAHPLFSANLKPAGTQVSWRWSA